MSAIRGKAVQIDRLPERQGEDRCGSWTCVSIGPAWRHYQSTQQFMAGINRIAWKMSRRPDPLASRQAEAPPHWQRIPCDSLLSYMRRVLACQSRCCRNSRGEERHSLDQSFVGHSGPSRPGLLLSRRDNPRHRQETRSFVPSRLSDHHLEYVEKCRIMCLHDVALVPQS